MELGMIGAGRMGANMARRLHASGHNVVLFDVDEAALQPLADEGFRTAAGLGELVAALGAPRAVWLMIPAGHVERTLDELAPLLSPDDIVVDGGNSWYRDAIDRASRLFADGQHFVDCGTSGGVHGRERGYCLMIGGDRLAVERLDPIFASLAPGIEATPRTTGREGEPGTAELGYLHCGPSGAGHFAKMIHNGIEYGLMAAYAEGFDILHHAGLGLDSNTALRDPDGFRYDFDLEEVAELWRRGSVIGSWLLDLTASALHENPKLDAFSGRVSDSGEGRWAVQAAIEVAAPVPVLSAALYSRFASRGEGEFAGRVLSAMRQEFGGHTEAADESREG